MLLWSKQEFAATGHDSFDANSLVMVTLRQATSLSSSSIVSSLIVCRMQFVSQIEGHNSLPSGTITWKRFGGSGTAEAPTPAEISAGHSSEPRNLEGAEALPEMGAFSVAQRAGVRQPRLSYSVLCWDHRMEEAQQVRGPTPRLR